MPGFLSDRLRAIAAGPPDQPPVRINVSLTAQCTAEERQATVAKLQALSTAPVNYRSALGMATAVIPRNRISELTAIEGVERADLDVAATHEELID